MIDSINHITLASKNIQQSFDFYCNILGFKPLCKWHAGAYFLVGEFWFCINYDEQALGSIDYTHIAFNVTQDDFYKIKNNITANNIRIFKNNKSEGDSLYFLDPDGHKLELHVGSWQTRIAHKKQAIGDWQNVEFFV